MENQALPVSTDRIDLEIGQGPDFQVLENETTTLPLATSAFECAPLTQPIEQLNRPFYRRRRRRITQRAQPYLLFILRRPPR
jgi:hypothetical protein